MVLASLPPFLIFGEMLSFFRLLIVKVGVVLLLVWLLGPVSLSLTMVRILLIVVCGFLPSLMVSLLGFSLFMLQISPKIEVNCGTGWLGTSPKLIGL